MLDIDTIMDMLDWGNPEEVQQEGRRQAQNIRCINAFIQPMNRRQGKNVWENCALILCEKSDIELRPYLVQLLEWLQDLNWPGALYIFNRVRSYSEEECFSSALDYSIRVAKLLNDEVWLNTLQDIRRR